MRTAIEYAGAERGLLILARDDAYRVEAEVTTSDDTVTVGQRQPSVPPAGLPEFILHYVMRTKESVLLHDAGAANPFSANEYIQRQHARSILCLPLLKQSRLAGVVYLENNLTAHVFTPARMMVLKLLASQAAMSLENTPALRRSRKNGRRRSGGWLIPTSSASSSGILTVGSAKPMRLSPHHRIQPRRSRLRSTALAGSDACRMARCRRPTCGGAGGDRYRATL